MVNKIKTFMLSHKKALVICITVILCSVVIVSIIVSTNSTIHTVTFFSDNNNVLLVEKVKHNQSADPPSVPELTYGNIFTKWDKDFSHVTSNLDIHPDYESVQGQANTFALQGVYGKVGESVMIPFMLCGDVKVSGFAAVVEYDPEQLMFDSVINPDGDVIYNDKTPGKIKINFVSANNATADIDICSLKMIPEDGTDKADLKVSVNSIYAVDDDGNLYVPEYNIIDSSVFIIS